MDESHLDLTAIVDSCLGIIVLELLKLAFHEGKSLHISPPRRISDEILSDVASKLPKVTTKVEFQIVGFQEKEHNWTK